MLYRPQEKTTTRTHEYSELHFWLIEDSTYEKVCRLSSDGLSNSEITEELGVHKSTVSRNINRGKEEGMINTQNM